MKIDTRDSTAASIAFFALIISIAAAFIQRKFWPELNSLFVYVPALLGIGFSLRAILIKLNNAPNVYLYAAIGFASIFQILNQTFRWL